MKFWLLGNAKRPNRSLLWMGGSIDSSLDSCNSLNHFIKQAHFHRMPSLPATRQCLGHTGLFPTIPFIRWIKLCNKAPCSNKSLDPGVTWTPRNSLVHINPNRTVELLNRVSTFVLCLWSSPPPQLTCRLECSRVLATCRFSRKARTGSSSHSKFLIRYIRSHPLSTGRRNTGMMLGKEH